MAVDSETSSPQAKALQHIEDVTRDVDSVQKRVLSEILSQNSDTEYLNRFGLGGATNRAAFKSKIPVVTYENLWPDIERIANGDKSKILCSQPILKFIVSTGTSSGKAKLIPITQEEMDRRMLLVKLTLSVVNHHVQGLDKDKRLNFMFDKEVTNTPCGLIAQQVSSSCYRSPQFRTLLAEESFTSPIEAILCLDTFQSTYAQMLCALFLRLDIVTVGAFFASSLLRIVHFLQLHWPDLVRDIAAGTLDSRLTDPALKASLANILKPDPALAELVGAECRGGDWAGIIGRIWPRARYLDTVVTGAMAQYIPMLDYYSNGLGILSNFYTASECFFGLNLNPICDAYEVSYTVMPHMAYFEFIPQRDGHDSAPLVELAEVEIGKDYEIVVTSYAGLWRYRVGDILRVTGFHNSAPQFRFLRRKNVILSVDVDKTDEAELHAAVRSASALLEAFNTSVVEYTSRADTGAIPGHYVVYWELLVRDPTRPPSGEALERCCLAVEESLSAVYRQGRAVYNSIGPLEIRVVKDGTFEELMDYAISRGATISQYKMPRCVDSKPIVELLDANVVSAHFSPVAPRALVEEMTSLRIEE